MSTERRMAVLSAIVEDYVHTSEPVGSRALLERHQLGVSAATVRNDMAALEDEGLIVAPHTSAGRIPTDAGYRTFVDQLSTLKPMSRAERSAIAQFLEGADALDEVLDRTVRLLATLTRQVAVVQYPSLTRSTVRHVELVPMSSSRLMVVVITGSGRVEQRVITTETDYTTTAGADELATARTQINAVVTERRLGEAVTALRTLDDDERTRSSLTDGVLAAIEEAAREESASRVTLAGTANLARTPSDFPLTLEPVLDALEQHVVLLRLLGTQAEQTGEVAVRIGSENPVSGLQTTSVVSTGYGAGDELVGHVGVLGPTRMNYPATISQVRAVATYLSRIITTG
ncbi:heat-inducible transcriptional repressor HrcA [Janibacter sp. UYMM211]|uniref:heat-inducible transcriptional repressor HrcA n=1 Tax=Janibacter sp. UYMM211 TaxID=3156342 RepID=UPI00339286D6